MWLRDLCGVERPPASLQTDFYGDGPGTGAGRSTGTPSRTAAWISAKSDANAVILLLCHNRSLHGCRTAEGLAFGSATRAP